jgi:2-polyprenyl-3-methyl-5-hydroxy-6-metoxy-1,4-benzoquinol methylase
VAAAEDQRKRWERYIQGQFDGTHPLEAMHQIWSFHEPLYQRFQQLVPPGARILEVGAGSGVNIARLSMLGYQAVGVDNSEKIIAFARECAERYGFDIGLEVADAFDLSAYRGRFDLVFSTGMIEHWPEERLVSALREQVSCAPVVVAEIPTKHAHYAAPITDEIPYTWRQLRTLFERSGLDQTQTFGYGSVPNFAGAVTDQLPPRLRCYLRRFGVSAMALGCQGHRP